MGKCIAKFSQKSNTVKIGGTTLYQVDAFTDTPYFGNPAAVLLQTQKDAAQMSDGTRQRIAAEMNLSGTSFVELQKTGDSNSFKTHSHYNLRCFTPTKEVALCGHATLAAAAAIILGEGNRSESLHFHTKLSGEFVVRRAPKDAGFLLAMDLPNEEPQAGVPAWAEPGSKLIKALVGDKVAIQEVVFNRRLKSLLIVLEKSTSKEKLQALQPDTTKALECASDNILSAIITTNGGGMEWEYDFYSRVFCPWAGVNEDPVTGSAHALLGPYWAKELGKSKLSARQCSARGGDIGVEVLENGKGVRVLGDAVLVFKGSLEISVTVMSLATSHECYDESS